MDKKNTTIGILLLVAAFAVMIFGSRFATPPPRPPAAPPPANQSAPAGAPTAGGEAPRFEPGSPNQLPGGTPPAGGLVLAAASDETRGEQIAVLENEFVAVRVTTRGGAIRDVALKKHRATKDNPEPYVLNALHAAPALSLLDFPGADRHASYTIAAQTPTAVTLRAEISGQLEITRTYAVTTDPEKEPYLIRHETSFRNLSALPLNTPKLVMNLGTAQPVDAHDSGMYLNVGAFDGEDSHFIGRGDFVPGWFSKNVFGNTEEKRDITIQPPTVWASTKNQFFATVLTPDRPGNGVTAQRVELPLVPGELAPRIGITGNMLIDNRQLAPAAADTLSFNFYAGPKEFSRLEKLGHREDIIMQFGTFIGFFSKLLLTLMKWLYETVFHNWGLAIIGTTVIIRTMLWPITASAARSAKRMGKLQPMMKEIQEKYKDDRQKQQEATLKLFKEHKVNPVGGCLPLFLQIPIFFGLFRMLQSASELRFAEFLWVQDLSAPDTVAVIPLPLFGGLPLNIMPILMGATMVLQMRMTPTPTTDNASARMMKIMPYIFAVMCYTFSSGLAVYWTASNIFSIFQQWMTNRRKEPETPATTPAAHGAHGAKHPRKPAAEIAAGKKKRK